MAPIFIRRCLKSAVPGDESIYIGGRFYLFSSARGRGPLVTCDRKIKNDSEMRHANFLNSICDVEENKRQRHVTCAIS